MSITVDQETETALEAQASARGMDLSAYLRVLAAQCDVTSTRVSRDDALRAWDEFCDPIAGLPTQPDETFSRDMIYHDHD